MIDRCTDIFLFFLFFFLYICFLLFFFCCLQQSLCKVFFSHFYCCLFLISDFAFNMLRRIGQHDRIPSFIVFVE
ncbi:hypothetical protein STCU_10839 [Strigomonas culicis]|uniref:Uncharacterized protein n=1 Tax=Strigomonas culicis TaxID=28005 RepID=S9V2P8_9TRYP|nr:hypothetical protein STCU_10839 [Strigomonas culicis]|eukprot:EPY17065.1 hypothetical protein STCU_10839 [Strigomonas culicis]